MTNSDQPNGGSAPGCQTRTEGESQGKTPFYRLLIQLYDDPNSMVQFKRIKDAHQKLGSQAKTEWTKEINDEDRKGQTPFFWLLQALDDNPEKLHGLLKNSYSIVKKYKNSAVKIQLFWREYRIRKDAKSKNNNFVNQQSQLR